MCALWTQNLTNGLPSGRPAAPLPALGDRTAWVAEAASPFGPLWLAASAGGLCGVGMVEDGLSFTARLARLGWRPVAADASLPVDAAQAALDAARTQLAEYFAGARRDFSVPLDLTGTTTFDRRVLDAMAAIPYGSTTTYGALARTIGQPGAARAVGHACGRNPLPLVLPCHRVVRAGGGLAGYGAGGPDVKAALLALEREEARC